MPELRELVEEALGEVALAMDRLILAIPPEVEVSGMARTAVFPRGRQDVYERYGYSAAIRSGDPLFVSGQVGVGSDGTAIEDRRAQIEQAFENLRQVLDAAGCTMSDIVDITSFHVDMFSHFEIFHAEKRKAFPAPPYPNWAAGRHDSF